VYSRGYDLIQKISMPAEYNIPIDEFTFYTYHRIWILPHSNISSNIELDCFLIYNGII